MNKFISLKSLLRSAVLLILITCAHSASASTVIPYGATISSDTTWTPADGPYVVEMLSVARGATLTILPGTIVKFSPSHAYDLLYVSGTLQVGALEGAPVIFTSYLDDVGGDTNGDGPLTAPSPGNWMEVSFLSGSSGTFLNTTLRYGGATPHDYSTGGFLQYGMIENAGGDVSVVNSTLSDSGYYGITQSHGSLAVQGSTVTRTRSAGIVAKGNVSIIGSTFTDLPKGFLCTQGSCTIGQNHFSNAGVIAADISGETVFQNAAGNWGDGGLALSLSVYGMQTIMPDSMPYLISGLSILSGGTLSVLPGTVIKMLPQGVIDNRGTLLIGSATATDRVTITSIHDDSVMGDTEGNGPANPHAGDWSQFYIREGTQTVITRTDIRYGGSSYYQYGLLYYNPMIELTGGGRALDHGEYTLFCIADWDSPVTGKYHDLWIDIF